MIYSKDLIIKMIRENQERVISVSELSKKYKVQTSTIYSWFKLVGIKPKKRDWEMIRNALRGRKNKLYLWIKPENTFKEEKINESSVRVRQIIEEVNHLTL